MSKKSREEMIEFVAGISADASPTTFKKGAFLAMLTFLADIADQVETTNKLLEELILKDQK